MKIHVMALSIAVLLIIMPVLSLAEGEEPIAPQPSVKDNVIYLHFRDGYEGAYMNAAQNDSYNNVRGAGYLNPIGKMEILFPMNPILTKPLVFDRSKDIVVTIGLSTEGKVSPAAAPEVQIPFAIVQDIFVEVELEYEGTTIGSGSGNTGMIMPPDFYGEAVISFKPLVDRVDPRPEQEENLYLTVKTTTEPSGEVSEFAVFTVITVGEDHPSNIVLPLLESNRPPVASFTHSANRLAISVDGSPSKDPDVGPMAYEWDFGDGATGEGITAEHTYAKAGTYPITLTVTDDGGMTSSITKDVSVKDSASGGGATAKEADATPGFGTVGTLLLTATAGILIAIKRRRM
ncbi:MAG: hypothetical protein CVT48_04240 [Thermoplasmata archaeon HGW-Thermoplasmata-1]|nr:MAG: hypothetical protein CVT48_04240 [Thermoplasmata archaeon HGW-Thermoplasmata-1]